MKFLFSILLSVFALVYIRNLSLSTRDFAIALLAVLIYVISYWGFIILGELEKGNK